MDKGYMVLCAMLAVYCLAGMVLFLRARSAESDEEKG
jgi:hypothetical protein